MSNDITALRAILFETLRGVKDGTVELDKARTISDISARLIETAKVEVGYLRATGGGESSFIDSAAGTNNLPPGITGITRHRLT